jgi:catalase (peroxidase I)
MGEDFQLRRRVQDLDEEALKRDITEVMTTATGYR